MRNKKSILILVVALVCLFFAVACQKPEDSSIPTEYALNCTMLNMEEGEEITLSISPQPTSDVVWETSDDAVVVVNAKGKITAKVYGEADVTATVDEQVLTCKVSVRMKNVLSSLFLLDMKIPDGKKDSLRIFQGSTYNIEPKLYIGDEKRIVDFNKLKCYNSEESVISAKIDKEQIEIKGLHTGTSELYATYEYEGKTLYSDVYFITVDVDRTVYTETELVSLLTPYNLAGGIVTKGTTAVPQLFASSEMLQQDGLTIDNEEVSWISADSSIVDVVNNELVSVGQGDTYVTAITEYGNVDIPVRVSYPISSAADLDFLSLVTYKEKSGTAKEYLGANYIFTNDIDYGTHARNYILPIASFNDGMNSTFPDPQYWGYWMHVGCGSARTSYYSLAWKSVLGLTERGDDSAGRYLINSDGTIFKGINPDSLWFSGRIDGNGYAIKNAWYMYDNYMGIATGSQYMAAHGSFIGLNAGTVENLEINVKTPNNYIVEQGGKYTQGTKINFNENLGSAYKTLKLLAADKTTVLAPYQYEPEWGRENVNANESAFVMINNNVIQNIFYNVNVTGGVHGTGRRSAIAGVFVLINFSQIKDCVVYRDINMVEGRMAGFNYALVGTNRNGVARLENGSYLHSNGGGNIQGCYILAGSTEENTSQVTQDTVKYCYGIDNYDIAMTDECSKVVYTTVHESGKYLMADYTGMITAATTNGNLSGRIWELDGVDNVVSLKKGCVSFF